MGFFISSHMKEQIINYFRSDKSYAGGVKLVIRYSLKLGLKKQVNLQPESQYLLGVIHEELREIAGISEQTMRSFLALPAEKSQVKMNISPVSHEPVTDHPDPMKADPTDEQPIPGPVEKKQPKAGKGKVKEQPVGKPRGRKK